MDRAFLRILNRPASEAPTDVPPAETPLPVNIEKPTRKGITKANEKQKNGKTLSPDNIPAEKFTADLDTSTEILFGLFEKMREE